MPCINERDSSTPFAVEGLYNYGVVKNGYGKLQCFYLKFKDFQL